MSKRNGYGVFGLMIAISLVSFTSAAAGPTGLIINEDNSHFFGGRTEADMTLEGLNAFVDQYAGTKVSQLFLNPNAMRASFASDVFDRIWDAGNQKAPTDNGHGGTWYRNARLLFERGLDPYAVWIARCREKGISPWLTSRMNDIHCVDDTTNFMHSVFWVEHPEYWRVPNDTSGSWFNRALNYGIPEVRERHMAFLRELLERYDMDGLELDWMRFGFHFKPGEEEQGVAILNDFMRQVRAMTNEWAEKRGHPIRLGARVPTHPDAARGLGMDGVAWAKEGLVDMLVPTPFWTTSDFDIPVELWRERLGSDAREVVLAPGIESNTRGYPGGGNITNDIEALRGFAAAAYHRDADQIYLFNFMDPAPMPGGVEAYRMLVEQGLGVDVSWRQPRRHIVSFRDTIPAGFPDGAQLPARGLANPEFRLYTGPVPAKGTVVFLAGLSQQDGVAEATFEGFLNDAPCTIMPDHATPAEFPGAVRAIQFDCPLTALKEGYNTVRVAQTPGQSDQQLIWAQIRIVPE